MGADQHEALPQDVVVHGGGHVGVGGGGGASLGAAYVLPAGDREVSKYLCSYLL